MFLLLLLFYLDAMLLCVKVYVLHLLQHNLFMLLYPQIAGKLLCGNLRGGVNDGSGKMRISLNPYLLTLFNTGYTLHFMEKRKLLKQDMAKWLCGYVESRKATICAPHYIKLKQIKELCGSDTKDMHRFRHSMHNAIETLTAQKGIQDGDLDEHDTFWFYKPT